MINAQLLSTGEIAVAPITGLGFGIDPLVGHRIYDLDGTLSAERFTDDPVAFPIDHHDYAEVPDGRLRRAQLPARDRGRPAAGERTLPTR